MFFTRSAAAVFAVAVQCTVTAAGARGTVEHRRAARTALDSPSAAVEAVEKYLKDADPGVRRFALFKLHEKDAAKGREAAKRLSTDPDDAVKALARELLRNRNAARRVSIELPLSQSPLNDHEVHRVKSVAAEGESFAMPAKTECDAVEVWFGKVTEHLMVWVNDVLVADFDPVREGGRELRCDVTKVVRWGVENRMWVTNEHGKDRWKKFSVEVLKCGN